MAFILVTVLIDVLSFGVIIPVLPDLIRQFTGGDYVHAAEWIGWFGFLFAGIQFFMSPVQGALSDRFGRRVVVLLSCFGLGVDFLLMAVANTLPLLLLARVFSGMLSASFSTANAYIADVTPAEKRAQAFGMIGAAFGIGFIAGPLIGGWLGGIGLRLPFWFAACMALLNFLYGCFVLPESLPPEKRTTKIDWSHANPFGAWKLLGQYRQVLGMAAVMFIANLAHYVYPSVFVIFADYTFHWGPHQVGWVLALVGVCSVIVNALLVGRIARAFGERRALLLGLGCGVVGFCIFGLVGSGAWFLVGVPISSMWAVAGPSAQTLITREVGADAQGRIQGALMSLVSLAGVIGPLVYAHVFAHFIDPQASVQLPGAPWLLAGALLAVAWALAWQVAPRASSAVD